MACPARAPLVCARWGALLFRHLSWIVVKEVLIIRRLPFVPVTSIEIHHYLYSATTPTNTRRGPLIYISVTIMVLCYNVLAWKNFINTKKKLTKKTKSGNKIQQHNNQIIYIYVGLPTCRGKWGRVTNNFQVSPKVCIWQIWLFLCIKLILGVNTIKKVHIHFTFTSIFLCINLDLIFAYISVCPVQGTKWIEQKKRQRYNKFYFLQSKLIHRHQSYL